MVVEKGFYTGKNTTNNQHLTKVIQFSVTGPNNRRRVQDFSDVSRLVSRILEHLQ